MKVVINNQINSKIRRGFNLIFEWKNYNKVNIISALSNPQI